MSSSAHGITKYFVEHTFKAPLLAYQIDIGEYPSTKEGLQALLTAPKGKEEKWKGPYLKKLPIDPWGNQYQYRHPSTKENVEFELSSLGKDGIESRDDIANWKDNQRPTPPFIVMLGGLVIIIAIAIIWRGIRTRRATQ